jgi:hypothetical protein
VSGLAGKQQGTESKRVRVDQGDGTEVPTAICAAKTNTTGSCTQPTSTHTRGCQQSPATARQLTELTFPHDSSLAANKGWEAFLCCTTTARAPCHSRSGSLAQLPPPCT